MISSEALFILPEKGKIGILTEVITKVLVCKVHPEYNLRKKSLEIY